MDFKAFTESDWVKAACNPEAREKVMKEFPEWVEKVKDSELVRRARRLWEYLTTDKCSTGDLVIAVAALLYLISPIDLIPDFIPLAGLLDDMVAAGIVLGYLDRKAAAHETAHPEA